MIAIRGIYDGKVVQPLEKVDVPENTEVIITFLSTLLSPESPLTNGRDSSPTTDLCGAWEDDRTAEEIIRDIYASRTVSRENIEL